MGGVVFGDAEAAVVDIVAADTAVAALTPVVSTDLIGYDAQLAWVRIARTGGIPTLWMRLDNAQITFDVRAPDKGAAFDIAEAARLAVFNARPDYAGHGLTLYDVVDHTGLTWSPQDTQPGVARYMFVLSLVTRPA